MHESMSAEEEGSPTGQLQGLRMKGDETVEMVTPAPVSAAGAGE